MGTAVPAAAVATPVSSVAASVARTGSAAGVVPASTAPGSGPMKTSLAGFDPGNIISDAVFTDRSTMTEAQIQAFFNSKVKTCQAGYTCLKDYKSDSVNRPADVYCKGYTGARGESAARIIHRVAQSCGINPQVLIVMLQKEQGLITHTWPSKWRYDAALGQACPDTAPCDPKFVGFFHQIYGAARQMQIYMEGRYFQWYQAGKTWQIQWHPDRERCGTGPVYIANKATEALYYYTPYQPNAAAMRAGYGTGDSCSSYGNRNFYNYFTDWFGSTQKPSAPVMSPAIVAEWQRLGGSGGQLGSPLGSATQIAENGGGQVQLFERGGIWLRNGASVAFGMANGAFLDNYRSTGAEKGPWGWPTSSATCGLTGGGCKMDFQAGTTYFSAATQSVLVPRQSAAAYAAAGAASGKWGYPKRVAVIEGNLVEQEFMSGVGVFSVQTGLVSIGGPILDTWRGFGGLKASIGVPSASAAPSSASGGGSVQEFTAGTVWESPAGAFAMGFGALRTSYLKAGGPAGAWGWPTSGADCGMTGGGCRMSFQNGTVGYSGATGSVLMSPVVTKEWLRVDPRSIGYPRASAAPSSANGGGSVQEFTAGTVWESPAGAFAMGFGALRTSYLKAGGPAGAWGWPTSGADCTIVGGGCSMSFQRGLVLYSSSTGSHLIPGGKLLAEWSRRGGPASDLGYPVSAATGSATVVQRFQHGTVELTAATGAITVRLAG